MTLSTLELQDQNRSEVPAQTVTHTSIGNLIGKCITTGRPVEVPQYTTLNEHYQILAAESLGVKQSRQFFLKYFGIGVRGSNCDGADSRGVTRLKVNQHQPIDANLFTAVPFICRPLSEDLPNVVRDKFRMRTIEARNGIDYVFYWLKLINFDNYNPSEKKITRDPITGVESVKPLIHVKDDLDNPQPVDFTADGSVPISNEYVNSSAILGCSLDTNDLKEIAQACKIYFGDAGYAGINEVGIAYGIDTTFRGQIAGGATIQYTEVMSAIFAHYVTERDGRNALTNTQVNMNLDHGSSAPLLMHANTLLGATGDGN